MPDKRNVWRVLGTDRDCSDAERFGTLMAPMFGKDVSPHDVKRQQDVITNEVLPFASEHDLILTVGPTCMVLVLAAIFSKAFNRVQFLVWDSSRSRYVEKTIHL